MVKYRVTFVLVLRDVCTLRISVGLE